MHEGKVHYMYSAKYWLFFRNLVLCGSMDHQAFILDLSRTDDDLLLQRFKSHTKYVYSDITASVHIHALSYIYFRYVIRVLWSISGTFFVTASYDKTVCVYR